MSTTSLIVEILVIGVMAIVAIMICLVGFGVITVPELQAMANNSKEYSSLTAVLSLAFAYQIGWLLNSYSYFVSRRTWMPRVRRSVLGVQADDYYEIRDLVLARGSTEILRKIEEHLSVIRLARAGCVTFFLSGVGFMACNQRLGAGLVLLLSAMSAYQAYAMYRYYAERIKNAHAFISNEMSKR